MRPLKLETSSGDNNDYASDSKKGLLSDRRRLRSIDSSRDKSSSQDESRFDCYIAKGRSKSISAEVRDDLKKKRVVN